MAELPARTWFAYPAVLLVQARALWGLWRDDLTPGDSADYFVDALQWSSHAKLNLGWSPLYDGYYGTIQKLTGGDAPTVERLHRAIIVLVLAALVLALARRLLPAGPALLVGVWWAVLPVNYDALYEAHLFVVPFLAGSALLFTGEPGPWRRGWGFALLVLAVLLIRNELVAAGILVAAALGWAGVRARRRGLARAPAAAVLVPLLCVALFGAVAYTRGLDQGGALRHEVGSRSKTVVCQHYALNYLQRHPDVRLNAFTECRPLMQRVFGEEHPTFVKAWSENPRAMAAFTGWNVRLLPSGLQLGLFNAVSGNDNPDFVPVQLGRTYPALLSVLLLALLVAGGRRLWLDRRDWAVALRPQRWAWAVLGATALGTLVVTVGFVRPRPSFAFGLTLTAMLVCGLALAALTRGRLERACGAAAVAITLLVLALLPVHYRAQPTPLADAYERLEPVASRVDGGERVAVSGLGVTPDVCKYLAAGRGDLRARMFRRGMPTVCSLIDYASRVKPLVAARGVEAALDSVGARILDANPDIAAQPAVARMIARPRRGWRVVHSGRSHGRPWAVLARA